MTDFAIPIIWVNYPITTPSGPAIGGLGHAGVVIVNGSTGHTRYFEYGRYGRDADGNPIGMVKTKPVPNLAIANGIIDGRSLRNMVASLNASAGKGTPATGAILPLDPGGYDAALSYALQAQNDEAGTLGEYSWANDNHCYSFAKAVAAAGGSWVDWFDGFWLSDNVPSSAMTELIANRGGFVIGGPQGDFLLGGASRYATDSGFNTSFTPDTKKMSPADGKQKPNEAKRRKNRVVVPAATDDDGQMATATHGTALDRRLLISRLTFNLFSDLTAITPAAMARDQWESPLAYDDLTDGAAHGAPADSARHVAFRFEPRINTDPRHIAPDSAIPVPETKPDLQDGL